MTSFTDSPFMTAGEKRRVLTQWRRFLQTLARDCPAGQRPFQAFRQGLYDHLIQHCSFIAHYNRLGFFEHYFKHGDDTAASQLLNAPDSCQSNIFFAAKRLDSLVVTPLSKSSSDTRLCQRSIPFQLFVQQVFNQL